MVLSLWMSSGRTMPATISSRTSKLTRISCLPSSTRLPFGSTCVTTAARLVSNSSLRSIEPLPSLDPLESAVRMRNGGANGDARADRLGADEIVDAGVFLVDAAALRLVLELGAVGDLDLHGEDVADLVGALILEEGARAGAPERIGLVDRRLRRGHRHLHRLVARPRRGILDGLQCGLLADVSQPVQRGATACKHRERAGDEHFQHRRRLALRRVCRTRGGSSRVCEPWLRSNATVMQLA